METKTKPTVGLSILSIVPLDIEKTYNVGLEIAREGKATFQGIFIWGLSNPNRDVQYLYFIAEKDSINSIIEKVKSSLGLAQGNILFVVAPILQPSEKPAPAIMTT